MEPVWEIISEVIILIVFIYPGAFIRWGITGFKREFKEVLNDDGYINGVVGLCVVGGMVGIALKWL
jgi:hypothetical protein